MSRTPGKEPYTSNFAASPEDTAGEDAPESRDRLKVTGAVPSRTPSPTQYEFIMTTGEETSTATRQKLKTVRSHVMKNYLQQQQRQGRSSGESSLQVASGDRRKGKQRARSSRSNSREQRSPVSSPASEEGSTATSHMGTLFSGFSQFKPFQSDQSSAGKFQNFRNFPSTTKSATSPNFAL